MATTPTKIWQALKRRVQTIPATGNLSPMPPIAWPASSFTPGSTPYIAVANTTVAPRRVMVRKGDHDRTGTLTIVYCAPIGQDNAVYQEAAGQIAAHFAEDTGMRYQDVCVKVVQAPFITDGFRDEGSNWWRVPINIRWSCSA